MENVTISYSIYHKNTEVARAYFEEKDGTIKCAINFLLVLAGQVKPYGEYFYPAQEILITDSYNEKIFLKEKLKDFYRDYDHDFRIETYQLSVKKPEGFFITRDYKKKESIVNFLDNSPAQIFPLEIEQKEIYKTLNLENENV